MVVTEDFSFPIITNSNTVQNRTILPPLWSMRIISNSDHALDRKDYELGTRKILRRSFSEVESQVMDMSKEDGRDHETKSKEDEEKMDMLWEGLNDDLFVQAGNGTSMTMMMSSSSSLSSPSSLVESNGSDCEFDLHNYGHNSVSACKDDQYQSTEDDQCNDMKFMGSGGFVHHRKKKNLEMVVKMMKKLFLIPDMAGKKGKKKDTSFNQVNIY